MRGLRLGKRGLVVGMVALAAIAAAAVGPKAARAVEKYRTELWRNGMKIAIERALHGEETVSIEPKPESEEEEAGGKSERDDALVRQLAEAARRGPEPVAVRQQRLEIAAEEARRWAALLPQPQRSSFSALAGPATSTEELTAAAGALVGQSAVSLGPANARFEWNGTQYTANDSGRPNTIKVDPRDAAVVYLATAGGGVWKTWQFGTTGAKWVPITETIGNLAIGAMDLDTQAPDTLWIGVGDFVDTAGGQLLRSTDAGSTWSLPMGLTGSYPAGTGGSVTASRIRDLRISPSDGNHILVATEVGLFQSTNAKSAAPTFQLINLPNVSAKLLQDGPWTIAYLGAASGQSHWLVSGVTACAPNMAPPTSGSGTVVGGTIPGTNIICTNGNLGDIWRSTDSGATWASIRAAGGLATALTAVAADGEIGRIALAATPSTTPASAVAYAHISTVDGGDKQIGVFKTTNGGQTWSVVMKSSSIASNPTTSGDCDTLDLAHGQAWYNLAIGVDPGNSNNVLVGGNLCSARTTNGGTTWDLVSHWLPSSTGGAVSGGNLPYVHADWHAVTISRVGGSVVAFAGTDGGIFSSTNLFTATPTTVNWTSQNQGIVTHLIYSVGSGDPVNGKPDLVFVGLQDNGTRFRDDAAGATPTTFNQVIGGDGFGCAVANDANGGNLIYWGSVYSTTPRRFCKPSTTNCNAGGAWSSSALPTLPSLDKNPFITRYSPVLGDANSSVISASNLNLWMRTFSSTTWTRLTPTSLANTIQGLHAAPLTYTIGGASARLYGLALTGGKFLVGTDKSGVMTWSPLSNSLGLGSYAGDPTLFLRGTSSITFPTSAAGLGGTTDGLTFLGSSVASVMSDSVTPIPASVGHLFKTTDGGQTWTPFHGNGSGFDLPNVPIEVVRFDPGDATDKTIYVGTDLGLYRTTDGGNTWARFGIGLPMVRISDLFIARNGGLLRIATYGRGVWEIYPSAAALKGVDGTGDWDRNLQIDGFDLLALASRLGSSPATTGAPLYDWSLDLAGSANGLDDADLTSLLSKFGNHP